MPYTALFDGVDDLRSLPMLGRISHFSKITLWGQPLNYSGHEEASDLGEIGTEAAKPKE